MHGYLNHITLFFFRRTARLIFLSLILNNLNKFDLRIKKFYYYFLVVSTNYFLFLNLPTLETLYSLKSVNYFYSKSPNFKLVEKYQIPVLRSPFIYKKSVEHYSFLSFNHKFNFFYGLSFNFYYFLIDSLRRILQTYRFFCALSQSKILIKA